MTTPCNPPGGKVHSSCLYLNPWSSSVYLTKQTEPSQSMWIVVVGFFFFPVGVPKDSRAVWEALSKPFLCPIQGKALPGMSFKGKMSSVDPPIVLFSFHLPLPTFKGPSSLWGNSFHRRKRRKLCPEEPLWILKTWGPQALARCFGGVLMLMQSALEKRNRFQTPKHENWNRFPYWLPSK